jgi:hypothetical protein
MMKGWGGGVRVYAQSVANRFHAVGDAVNDGRDNKSLARRIALPNDVKIIHKKLPGKLNSCTGSKNKNSNQPTFQLTNASLAHYIINACTIQSVPYLSI